MTIVLLGKNFELDLLLDSNCIPLEMLWLKPGSLMMGYSSSRKDCIEQEYDKPFEMKLSRGFWLGKFPLTQAQWRAVMNGTPNCTNSNNLPINNVTWNDANEFCNKLNKQYSAKLPDGYKFSLPTEAQWEYSCKASTISRNYRGDSIKDVLEIAWCLENSGGTLHDVGLKTPNAWGLYDMFGNVFEWCYDDIADYPKGKACDWIGADHEQIKVVRGGSYLSPSNDNSFDSAYRNYVDIDTKKSWYGFRLCLRVE
ncbi:MAG: formylglycine-generating enzyme family protein [Okeania sp. SIO3H1]|nr:formylglycine-generating enzyme family protein [Okeania sp. SIO3H1]